MKVLDKRGGGGSVTTPAAAMVLTVSPGEGGRDKKEGPLKRRQRPKGRGEEGLEAGGL